MKLIIIILLGVLCLGMGAVYTIFNNRVGWQGIVLRGLTMLSILILALVLANLKELINAMPMFFIIALSVNVISQTTYASNTIDEKAKRLTFSIFVAIANTLFAVSAITLSQFNVFGLIAGLFLGLGFGFAICAFKKYKDFYNIISELIIYSSLGLLLGLSLMGILGTVHLISAIFLLSGAGIMLIENILRSVMPSKKVVLYITDALYISALIIMTFSIYFF